jgi:hypothetical protein
LRFIAPRRWGGIASNLPDKERFAKVCRFRGIAFPADRAYRQKYRMIGWSCRKPIEGLPAANAFEAKLTSEIVAHRRQRYQTKSKDFA